MQAGAWTAACEGVPADDCEGVATLFIHNLARNGQRVLEESGGRLVVEARLGCPKVPDWADPGTCWQASEEVSDGTVCMVVARQSPPRTSTGFGQVGGDDLTGRATIVARSLEWPPCTSAVTDRSERAVPGSD